ncbi:ABC transporter permease [Gorillibacterium sp. sgz500922]|uniref:ABC transporter permease n=1 Tax=Gorillibacterium sp. sgz500922 TaxID=3446694 RepID=UPI003F678363
MKLFGRYLYIQLKMDIREKGTLLNYYVIPLIFYLMLGAVFGRINEASKETLAATMIVFAVTMGAVLGIPGSIVKMRESGMLRAFVVNGIGNGTVLFVHAVSAFLHVSLVSLIIYFTSPHLFDSSVPVNQGWFLGIVALFLFTSTVLGLLIGTISRNQAFATMLSQVIFLPSLLISGIMFPASMLPKALIWLGRILPATQANESFLGFAYREATDYSDRTALLVLAAIGAAVLVLLVIRAKALNREQLS